MTRMIGPDCAVMCNLINTHTHTHTYTTHLFFELFELGFDESKAVAFLVHGKVTTVHDLTDANLRHLVGYNKLCILQAIIIPGEGKIIPGEGRGKT